jgi:ketosteroid isomerase-like protein
VLDLLTTDYGPDSRDRLADAAAPGEDGALAALETFYRALNHADLDLLTATWADDPLAQLDNPVGGILRGRAAVTELYARIFAGGLDVRVTFTDAVRFTVDDAVVVTGREVGSYAGATGRVPISIRTTRVLGRTAQGWRLVHHHGSLDDAEVLAAYRRAALGS